MLLLLSLIKSFTSTVSPLQDLLLLQIRKYISSMISNLSVCVICVDKCLSRHPCYIFPMSTLYKMVFAIFCECYATLNRLRVCLSILNCLDWFSCCNAHILSVIYIKVAVPTRAHNLCLEQIKRIYD